MDYSTIISIIGLLSLLLLLFMGIPIAVDFFLIGFLGIFALIGTQAAISFLGQSMYYTINSPGFAALPLFILMGSFAARGGFARRAYDCLFKLTSKLPGSLAIATSFGCAAFGAISGSSLATAALFGRIAMPEMERYKYDNSFALGTIASSGSFAAMIPPSAGLIIYAMLTEQSIGKMFLAGILPGVITAFAYVALIIVRVKLNPKLAPTLIDKKFTPKEKIDSIKNTWAIFLIILIIFGGIYSGLFTPTEAAAVGCLLTFITGFFQGSLNKASSVKKAIKESAKTSSMVFTIIIGAFFFSRFIAVGQLTAKISYAIQAWEVDKSIVLGIILVLWFFLGMIMIPSAIKALVLPIIFPVIVMLGYNPIWFGIIIQKLSEIAVVTPPVGLNVYALKGVMGEKATLETIFKGIWPFVLCDILVLFLLLAFPNISLFLPNLFSITK